MLGNMRFRIELLVIGICCLPVALIAVLLTLSGNTCRLNLNRKLQSLKFVSCDSRHYTSKACGYSCQHRLWRHVGVGEFGENDYDCFSSAVKFMPLSSFFVAVLFCDLLYLVILCPSVNEVILYIAGIIYDVIVEPPSIGSTTDEHGHSKPVCYFFYLLISLLSNIHQK